MTFNHNNYNQLFLQGSQPINGASNYSVTINGVSDNNSDIFWRVIGTHHLLPLENWSNHHIYFDVLDEFGKRITPPAKIAWTWEGKRPDEPTPPVVIDKPPYESGANLAMFGGQKMTVWVLDNIPSESVSGLTARHADEPLPDGGLLNTIGHHSFYVVFQRTKTDYTPSLPPVVIPTVFPVQGLEQRINTVESDIIELKTKIKRLESRIIRGFSGR